jgi:CRP-like cAMP-binding protein
MDKQLLLERFAKTYPGLNNAELEKIAEIGSVHQIQRKEKFIFENKIDRRIAFVLEGLFRGYLIQKAEEITIWFSGEYELIASYNGILLNESSKITYQALEDSTIFVFEYDDLKQLAKDNIQIAFSIITMLEKFLIESLQRNERFILMDAETRYNNLVQNKPNIVQRVPQKLLASYIGITPVSLSRLRARLNKKRL